MKTLPAQEMGITAVNDDHYQTLSFDARGERLHIVAKPGVFGWQRVDPATSLLIESMRVDPGDTVLDLGCGYGLVGLAAAKMTAPSQVYLVDHNVVAVECARRTLAGNDVPAAHALASDCTSAVRGIAFDLIVSHLPRGKETAHQFIIDAATLLKTGGRLYIAGRNNTGVKPSVKFAHAVFGNSRVLAYKKGGRVAMCIKNECTSPPASDYYQWREFEGQIGEQTWRIATKPGVFSWRRLDEGTRALIETMDIRPGETVLDIGCGCGIIGAAAAKTAAQVDLVDSNIIAVEAARRTLALNEIANAEVYPSDGIAAVRDKTFDVVVTNPPFHQGRATDYYVAHQFIRDAARVLKARGRLYVVANRFIRYERQMEQCLQTVRVAYEDRRFRVLLGQRPRW